MRKILLGLSGSIACYKTCELIRLFKKNNDQVRTMVTQNALEFIGASTLSALTGEPVFQNYDSSAHTHIELAKWADQLIIAPATAQTIAALAHGFANDLLTTECLAFTGPKAIAPAMNTHMYTNSIVQQNLNALKTHGFQILEPESGELSCGDTGIGRMREPMKIFYETFPKNGKKVLISLGRTETSLDPVRILTNRSSGKMGFALAEIACELGYEVILVAGHTDFHPYFNPLRATTNEAMFEAIKKHIFDVDLFFSVAAPVDFEVSPKTKKIKKSEPLILDFKPGFDIFSAITKLRPKAKCIAFAAETDQVLEPHGRKKLKEKNADGIFINDVSAGQVFGHDESAGIFLDSTQEVHLPKMTKKAIARKLFDLCVTP